MASRTLAPLGEAGASFPATRVLLLSPRSNSGSKKQMGAGHADYYRRKGKIKRGEFDDQDTAA